MSTGLHNYLNGLLVAGSLICSSLAPAQKKCNATLVMALNAGEFTEEPIEVLVLGDIAGLKASLGAVIKLKYYYGNIASLSLSRKSFSLLLDSRFVSYIEYEPVKKGSGAFLADSIYRANRLDRIRTGENPFGKMYTGQGVVIGIIDSGIDLTHPDFKDESGKTRVRYLWDQSVNSGQVQTTFNYGQEWNSSDINRGLCTHTDKSLSGHGSFVAGIAAGNGNAPGSIQGCAPNAELIVVALDPARSGPVMADAVKYIVDKAETLGKPLVINLSYGAQYGSHDGTGLETKLVERMLFDLPGRVLVAAAGNSGNLNAHIKYKSGPSGNQFTWINGSGREIEFSLFADLAKIKQMSFSIGANRRNYSDLAKTAYRDYKYDYGTVKTDTLFAGSNRIGIVKRSTAINPSGVCEMHFKIVADSLDLLWRIEAKGSGEFDAWHTGFVSGPIPTEKECPAIKSYLQPDPHSSLVNGLACSKEIITVGSYANTINYMDEAGNFHSLNTVGETVSAFSSSGPTRDGRYKPDILATGEHILSCLALNIKGKAVVQRDLITRDGFHWVGSGTSFASALVSGWVALYLQKYPKATNRQIKQAIITNARKDKYTGLKLPDFKCGYGKLDGYRSFMSGNHKK
jgi:minor extracellular serine protease Vpr